MKSGIATIDPERVIDAALAARDAGRGVEMIPSLREAIKAYPANPRLWQTLGVLHRALDDSAAAIDAFAEAARLSPGDIRAAHGVAQSSLEAGRPATALFESALALAPSDGSLLLGRAAAQVAEGHAGAAIDALDAIVSANPTWYPGQAALARMRWAHGQPDKLFAGYARALAALPREASLWGELLNLLVQMEQFGHIDGVLGRARSALSDSAAFPVFEAVAASELRDDARADRLFAALAASREPEVVVRHMRHLLRSGRPAEAAARGEALLGSKLGHAEAGQIWPYMALAWRMLGDPRHDWLFGSEALIGVYDLGEAIERLPGLVPLLRRLHGTRAHPVGQSVRGGTQTDGPLFQRAEPEIVALRRLIERTVAAHVRDWPVDPAHPVFAQRPETIRFSGSWSVRLTGAGGGHHSHHIHPQGWISSALYLGLPAPDELGAPPAGWLSFGQPPAELGIDLPPMRLVEPRVGRLVLFPSILWHGTMPFAAGERLTVAFDVAPPPGA